MANVVVLALLSLAGLAGTRANAGTDGVLVFVAPTNHSMPLARFRDGEIAAGIVKDLGMAIAQRLGVRAQFLSVPGRRVAAVLAAGQADGVCYVLPEWIEGDFHWTEPFIPNTGVIAARADAPVVHQLADLARAPVGTVVGYRYPDLVAALGEDFIRDDATTTEHVVRKLALGRTRYAVIEEMTLAYHQRADPRLALRTDLRYAAFKARCAFSRMTSVPMERIDRAIASLVRDGGMDVILARYR